MAKKPPKDIPIELVDLYDKLLATHSEIDRKGANNPYTSVNGHMFSGLSKTGLGLRLGKEDREKFPKEYNTELLVSYGAIMKEYVVVPNELFKDTERMKEYLYKSYEYTKSLKPKPTTKKKK